MTWQYRGKLMVTPHPLTRKTFGPFPLDLISLYPERELEFTGRLERFRDRFLDAMAFGTDQQGCPVVLPPPSFSLHHTELLALSLCIRDQALVNVGCRNGRIFLIPINRQYNFLMSHKREY